MIRRTPKGLLACVACVYFCAMLFAHPSSGVWLDVPFIRQEKDACGAATVAMVMRYWLKQQDRLADATADPVEIQRVLYSRKARGIYAADLEHYLRQHGFRTFAFSGTWNDLKEHLSKGRPLIVALKPPGQGSAHFVVIAGLNWEQGTVLLNDPAQRKLLKQDQRSFEKEWRAVNNWTLLALPQPQIG